MLKRREVTIMIRKMILPLVLLCVCAGLVSAQEDPGLPTQEAPPAVVRETVHMTAEQFHQALKSANHDYAGDAVLVIDEHGYVAEAVLSGTPVEDLSPIAGVMLQVLDLRGLQIDNISALAGTPVRRLFIDNTRIADISPLKGAKLELLYLKNAKVSDLSPLAGMRLVDLNLEGCPVSDIAALQGMPLEMLWLNETKVSDITPLAGAPLIALTLRGTNVSDLRPLAGGKLERLHIGGTPVADLTPLKGLPLKRLIFTPKNITAGMDIVRNMPTIKEIGVRFDKMMKPSEFWQRYDEGEFKD